MDKIELVLLRHGKSVDNVKGCFSGWHDCDLAEKGIEEAREAGRRLKEKGYSFDVAITSYLKRAIKTLHIVLEEMDLLWIPEIKDWRFNERHYGALQEKTHEEIIQKFGKEQEWLWRRSFSTRPPLLEDDDPRLPEKEKRYQGIKGLPRGESIKDVIPRVSSAYNEVVVPLLQKGKKPIIVASHNSLRSLVAYLENLGEEEIPEVNIPTGFPLIYELNNKLQPIRKFYLATDEEIENALKSVKVSRK